MMGPKGYWVVLLFILGTTKSFAFFEDANDLKNQCDQSRMNCMQYVQGVMDGVGAAQNDLFCWPETATLGQATDIFEKWLRDNPQVRTMPAGAAVLASLKEAFPTKVMWRPPQEDSNGDYTSVPMTLKKSSERGEWVGTCDGQYVNDFGDFFTLWFNLPENYEYRDIWWDEYFQ